MPPLPGMVLNWHSLIARHAKDLRIAWTRVTRALDAQVTGRSQAQLQPVLVRNAARQPLHLVARIRQGQSRWYSTARSALRHFSTDSSRAATRQETAAFLKTRVGAAVQQSNGRAPFASTLRPNLTGGTIGRTAGGYTLGGGRIGGARYFSHGPASQAQVVQNVSQAMRAFCLNGHKAQFDGFSSRTGEKRFKTVSSLQEETSRIVRSVSTTTPGSWVDFRINPTITALTPLSAFELDDSFSTANTHLNSDGLLNVLSVDFSRALKDLAVVLNDIKKLSALGDLPISLKGSNIRVYFPGCDADSVERLCAELNIQRGLVTQDPAFDSFVGADMALLFPFAPSEEDGDLESLFTTSPVREHPLITLDELLTPLDSDVHSTSSDYSELGEEFVDDNWYSRDSSYQSVRTASISGSDRYSPLEYQGIEGIYRFLEQCDSVGRR